MRQNQFIMHLPLQQTFHVTFHLAFSQSKPKSKGLSGELVKIDFQDILHFSHYYNFYNKDFYKEASFLSILCNQPSCEKREIISGHLENIW